MSTVGYGLDWATMDLVDSLPPSIVKDKPYTFNESYLSDYYTFTQMLLSFPPVSGVGNGLHLGVKFGCCDDGLSVGVH